MQDVYRITTREQGANHQEKTFTTLWHGTEIYKAVVAFLNLKKHYKYLRIEWRGDGK